MGLSNLGNTCYANVTLQGLGHCEPLMRFFRECPWFLPPKTSTNHSASSRRKLIHAMNDFFGVLYGGRTPVHSPKELLASVFELNPMFRGYGQQDAQEFLGVVLEAIHEEIKFDIPLRVTTSSDSEPVESASSPEGERTAPVDTRPPHKRVGSLINDIFEGLLLSEVTCSSCKRVSTTEENFRILPVSIPTKKQRQRAQSHPGEEEVGCGLSRIRSGGVVNALRRLVGLDKTAPATLRDCLTAFCTQEDLTGADKYKCEHCNALHDSTKKLSVLQLPEILCIHVKRFRYDGVMGTQFGSKVSEHLEFAISDLDLSPHMRKSETHDQGNSKFDLVGVVNHRGGLGGGHYVSYALNFLDDTWYEFDDDKVHPVTVAEVMRTEAYILFYRARESAHKSKERRTARDLMTSRQADRSVSISSLWLHKFFNLNRPGPIDNNPFFCQHDQPHVLPDDVDRLTQIPLALWEVLVSAYGGGPCLETVGVCRLCEQEEEMLRRRREHEQQLIQQHDKTFIDPGDKWYIIDRIWLHSWLCFVNENGPVPTAISNHTLLGQDGAPRSGLEKGRHYRGVNAVVWGIFQKMYDTHSHARHTQHNTDTPTHTHTATATARGRG